MIYPSEINTEKIKDFLHAIYRVKKSEIKRKKHRAKISGHIKKLKKKTLGKNFNKKDIEEEFEKLETHFHNALERERQILQEQRHGSDLISQMHNRLDKLEKRLASEREKQDTLNQIKVALQRLHEEVKVRKKKHIKIKERQKELEEKITKRL